MLCNAGNRILRKCRSERRLREKSSAHAPSHARKDSSFSTSTSASDVSNHHSQQSVDRDPLRDNHPRLSEDDWDPLRLHPPMDYDKSPLIPAHVGHRSRPAALLPPAPAPGPRNDYQHTYGDDVDIDDIIGSYGLTALRPPPPLSNRRPLFQRMKTAEMEIHEGFEFGFAGGNAPLSQNTIDRHANNLGQHHYHDHLHSATMPVSIAARHRRPSTASSTGSDCSSIFLPLHGAVGVPATPMPMSPTTDQRRPRPKLGDSSSPEFLIKRGDWKRRGIVFVSEEAKVTEDDCFDLP